MEIAKKVALTLLVPDGDLKELLEKHQIGLRDLTNTEVALLSERPPGVASLVVRGIEMVIPLDGVVDFEAEIERLDKVLAKVDLDILQLEKRASNKGFMERAPSHVVEEVKGKLSQAIYRRDTLQGSRARLVEAMT